MGMRVIIDKLASANADADANDWVTTLALLDFVRRAKNSSINFEISRVDCISHTHSITCNNDTELTTSKSHKKHFWEELLRTIISPLSNN